MTEPVNGSELLPPNANLEYLKKLAKDELRALRESNPEAKLADAQYALAVRYGFARWRELKAKLDDLQEKTNKQLLIDAIKKDDGQQLSQLLKLFPELLHADIFQWISPMLHHAAYEGKAKCARVLIDHGFDVNMRDEGDNAYPMHFAAEKGHLEIVKMLHEAGGDVHGENTVHGMHVLGWATCFAERRDDIVAYLLANGAKHDVFSAVAMGEVELLEEMLTHDPSFIEKRFTIHDAKKTLLMQAAHCNQVETLQWLISQGADVHAKDGNGHDVMYYAGKSRVAAELTPILQTHGLKLSLGVLINSGELDAAEAMIAAGVSQDELNAAMHVAIEAKNQDATFWIIERGADINAKFRWWECQQTALHVVVAGGDEQLEFVKRLVEAGADTTIRDSEYDSPPLGWAHHFQALQLIEYLKDLPS